MPVPIVVKIPAILGRSRFHSIKDAIPKIINISEKLVNITAKEDLNFLLAKKIIIETPKNAIKPAIIRTFINSFPRRGEIVSNFIISSL